MNNEDQSNEGIFANLDQTGLSRRGFLHGMGGLGAMLGMGGLAGSAGAADTPTDADGKVIPGFEKGQDDPNAAKGCRQVSDRKIKVGIAGYGLCKFGAAFFYQNDLNVEVVAATDLDPGRCAGLARAVGAKKTYPSCEEMIKDKSIEAIYIATDAPSHSSSSTMPSITGGVVARAADITRSSGGPVASVRRTSVWSPDCCGEASALGATHSTSAEAMAAIRGLMVPAVGKGREDDSTRQPRTTETKHDETRDTPG